MMSISSIKNSSAASKYYTDEEKTKNLKDITNEKEIEDKNITYHLKEKDQGQFSEWYGKLADEIGLSGKEVESNFLRDVLDGKLNTETVYKRQPNHKAGLELTFSAPKSVSILALVGGDERLLKAHENAVKHALSELEKDVAQFKTTDREGKYQFVNTEKMLFALVRHKTSREDEPQLHTHALAANMTRDEEGLLRALASTTVQKDGIVNGSTERIYHNQKYYTSLYQGFLAKEAEKLGYSFQAQGNNLFELNEVPADVRKEMSTRSEQIKDHLKDIGFNSQAAKDISAKTTRNEKSYIDAEALHKTWDSTLLDIGFDAKDAVAQIKHGELKIEHSETDKIRQTLANEAVARTISHLSEGNTRLAYQKIVEASLNEFNQGKNDIEATALDIKQALDKLIKDNTLIALDHDEKFFTTQSIIDKENRLIRIMVGKNERMGTTPNYAAISQLLLPEQHAQTIENLIASTKQVNVIDAINKDQQQVAKSLLHTMTESGKQVHLVSPNYATKLDNQDNVKRESHTFVQSVKNVFRDDNFTHTTNQFITNIETDNKDVVLVDNAHKLAPDELIALIEKTKANKTKLILMNSPKSRQGFRSNNALELIKTGNVNQFSWNRTQDHSAALKLYQSNHEVLVNKFVDAIHQQNSTQVIATTNKEARELTLSIRDAMMNEGLLSRSGITIQTKEAVFLSKAQAELSKYYPKGGTLAFNTAEGQMSYHIIDTDKKENTVTLLNTNGETSTIKANKIKGAFLTKPVELSLNQGERIVTGFVKRDSHLPRNSPLTVLEATGQTITFQDHAGKTLSIPTDELKDEAITYNYAATPSKLTTNTDTVLLSSKSYSLSKELIHDLTANTQEVHIFTDDTQKAEKNIQKSDVSLSGIQHVLNYTDKSSSFIVNDNTNYQLTEDITKAVSILNEHRKQKLNPSFQLKNAVDFALNHIAEREASYTQKELVIEAVRHAFEESGTSFTKDEIITELTSRENTLSSEYQDGTRWTTQEVLETERHIINTFKENQNIVQAYATEKQVNEFMEGKRATVGQKDSIKLISTSKDRFVAIQGLAGTGKSTMLETNIDLIKSVENLPSNKKPNRVLGLAPTNAAVKELKEKNVEAQTLASFLTDLERGVTQPEDYQGSLIFLDESSMVSNRIMKQFMEVIQKTDSKAVFLGDREQLLSQEAGKPFDLAIREGAIKTAYMTDIVRQNAESLLTAVKHIVDKQATSTLESLKEQPNNGGLTEVKVNSDDLSAIEIKQQTKEKLIHNVARDYAMRTPESRDNTLVIAYTNNERDEISYAIRQELGLHADNNIVMPRLRSINASQAELQTMMPYKEGFLITQKNNDFARIKKVYKEEGMVVVQDLQTEKESTIFPRKQNHQYTKLFSLSEQLLAEGDKVITRFNDKEKRITPNMEYTVSSIDNDNQLVHLSSRTNGAPITLNAKSLTSAFWDYGYTRTADMAQGTTYRYVIALVQSDATLTDSRRGYIDISRASESFHLYTDNEQKLLKTWKNKDVNKASAIETFNSKTPFNEKYFNLPGAPEDNPQLQTINGELDTKKLSDFVKEGLLPLTESLSKKFFGEENKELSNKDHLVIGDRNQHVKVSLTGDWRGMWRDTNGNKGNMVTLLKEHGENPLGYTSALKLGYDMVAKPEKHALTINKQSDKLKNTLPEFLQAQQKRGITLFKQSQPVTGTLAEVYMNSQGVQTEVTFGEKTKLTPTPETRTHSGIRYHPAVYDHKTKTKHPALLSIFSNTKGEVTAVKADYLTQDGQLNTSIPSKLFGSSSTAAVKVNSAKRTNNTSIITFNTTDALKVNQLSDFTEAVLSVNNVYDIHRLPDGELHKEVIIVCDTQTQGMSALGNTLSSLSKNHNIRVINNDETLADNLKHERSEIAQQRISDPFELVQSTQAVSSLLSEFRTERDTLKEPQAPTHALKSSIVTFTQEDQSKALAIVDSTLNTAISVNSLAELKDLKSHELGENVTVIINSQIEDLSLLEINNVIKTFKGKNITWLDNSHFEQELSKPLELQTGLITGHQNETLSINELLINTSDNENKNMIITFNEDTALSTTHHFSHENIAQIDSIKELTQVDPSELKHNIIFAVSNRSEHRQAEEFNALTDKNIYIVSAHKEQIQGTLSNIEKTQLAYNNLEQNHPQTLSNIQDQTIQHSSKQNKHDDLELAINDKKQHLEITKTPITKENDLTL